MARLDKDREAKLTPLRMEKAIEEIEKIGFKVDTISDTELSITTDSIQNSKVKFFPYSGWATGKDIKDGRGLTKLLKQLKNLKQYK